MQSIYVILLTFAACSVLCVVVYQICKISEECEKYRLREIRVYPVRNYRIENRLQNRVQNRIQNRIQNIHQYIGAEKKSEYILTMRNCPD